MDRLRRAGTDGESRAAARRVEKLAPGLPPPGTHLLGRLLAIGAATVVMIASVVAAATIWHGTSGTADAPARVLELDDAIDAEARVFRTGRAAPATGADAVRRPAAHPRTLETFRALRAYPGAPPRVPHGLTAEEFRGNLCNACHEFGGYSPRFAAYTPVTPHPEQTACLQCHAVTDALVGTALPGQAPDAHCRQCHTTASAQAAFAAIDWRPAAWPRMRNPGVPGAPPVIPHELELREDCLACHAGPAAVAEIRTSHPERLNCRQCHVLTGEEGEVFTRPPPRGR
jgi:nitrate reductase (cytochrome), electron transfer subunit